MALMVPQEPRTFNKAEKEVFYLLQRYLPETAVVYHNKEVYGQEFDFCVLLPDGPIIIIEVKGWSGKDRIAINEDLEKVVFAGHSGATQEYEYPKNQSRKYRFALLKKIQTEYNFNPKIFDLVCYPRISRDDYCNSKLDLVSGGMDWVLLQEDLASREAFSSKLQEAIQKARPFGGQNLNAKTFNEVRLLFESKEHLELTNARLPQAVAAGDEGRGEDRAPARTVYSILAYIDSIEAARGLIDEYIKGTKLYLLASGAAVYDQVLGLYQECIRKRNLMYVGGRVKLASAGRPYTIDAACASDHAHTFNAFNFFLTYSPNGSVDAGAWEGFAITDGSAEKQEEHGSMLAWFDRHAGFNLSQYRLEHADSNKHLLVVAGAGTGKTFSMVSRLTYLQYVNSYLPEDFAERIAMLTFTNEAADTMKERLKLCFQNYYMLTGDYAWFAFAERVDAITISTIHAFSRKVMQKYGSSMGYGKEITIVSGDYERRESIEEALEHYLRIKVEKDPDFTSKISIPVYHLTKFLLEILNRLYQKNVSILTQQLDFMNPPPGEMGEILHELISSTLREAEQKYQLQLAEENKVHLSDLINKLRQFMRYREHDLSQLRAAYLFVDEFQDTDNGQIELLKELQARLGFRYFVVGDIKQCIYRFRGAEEIAFAALVETPLPADWLWFPMTRNYRSDSKLLAIYAEHFRKWGKSKKLVYLPGRDTLEGVLELNGQRNKEDYYRVIRLKSPRGEISRQESAKALIREINDRSDEIKRRIEEGQAHKEAERTIAVLVRTNKEARDVYEYGRDAAAYAGRGSIFIEVDTGGDLFISDPAMDLYKLVAALKYPGNPKHLFNLSTTAYFAGSLYLNQLYGKEEQDKLKHLWDWLNYSIKTCSNRRSAHRDLGGNGRDDWLGWVCRLKHEPVLKVLRSLIGLLRPWDCFAAAYGPSREEADKARSFYRRNLELVFEKLAASKNTDYITINSLENYLKIKITAGQEEKTREAVAPAGGSGVRVVALTVHKAKGLEFDTVILPYGYRRIDKIQLKSQVEVMVSDTKVGYRVCYTDKDGAGSRIILQNSFYDPAGEETERMREETRILYVAMTRAIRNFTLFAYDNIRWPDTWQGLLNHGR